VSRQAAIDPPRSKRRRPDPGPAGAAPSRLGTAGPEAAIEPRREPRLPAILRFPLALARRLHEDQVPTLAAALAFVTVLSLVPLLAAFSFVGERVFAAYRGQILGALAQVLPYGQETIAIRIEEFLTQSANLPQFGFVAFALVSLSAFGTLESILNRIWRVTLARPFKVRFLSFTLLLFWGPLLIGATFSGLLLLEQRPELASVLHSSYVLRAAPFLAVALGLTMLYWLVPYAPVRFRAAAIGGTTAAAAFEILRHGFSHYVSTFGGSTNLIYGGFAVALFFMLSINFTWILVLTGCEIAYLVQHPASWSTRRQANEPLREPWAALVALALLAVRFRAGRPLTPLVVLEAQLGLPAEDLRALLAPLVEQGVLAHPTADDTDVYLLGRDPGEIRVASLFALFDTPRERQLAEQAPRLAGRLAALQTRLVAARNHELGRDVTLAELVREPAEPPSAG
jgi:membrane protein